MYGRAEHSEALRRLQRVANVTQDARNELGSLRTDLRQDDWIGTEEARGLVRDAAVLLRAAERKLDAAAETLPTPVAEPDPAALARALYRGGGNDVA